MTFKSKKQGTRANRTSRKMTPGAEQKSPASDTVKRFPYWALVVPGTFMMAWGGNHFTPLLHMYQELGDYARWQVNLLLGMYVFGLVPGLMMAANLSDRHGRKIAFIGGLLTTIVGNLILALSLESFTLMCIGRVIAGVGVGVAMSVGTTWVKELSCPPFDMKAGVAEGARRPSLTLTLGFAIGAAVSGICAQYIQFPHLVPYFVLITITALCIPAALAAPETRGRVKESNSLWKAFHVPSALDKRFTRVLLPAAPWAFAAAGVAYAVIPSSEENELGDSTTIYATVLTVLTLGTGAVIQGVAMRIDRACGGRGLQLSLLVMTVGMALAAVATWWKNPWLGVFVAMLLGSAFGLSVICGLGQVQRIATPDNLSALTGAYYAVAYTGFLLPTVLAALLPVAPYPVSLSVVTGICALCLVLTHRAMRTQRGRA